MDLCNRHPILYLGKDRDTGCFYFFGNKLGTGRFLKYMSYPMWCGSASIGNFIDLTAELPLEVMAEVLLFVNGKTSYEIQPKRRGRAEKIIRHEISPAPTGQEANATIQTSPTSTVEAAAEAAVTVKRAGSKASHAQQPSLVKEGGSHGPTRGTRTPNGVGRSGVSEPVVQPGAAASSKPSRRRSSVGPDVLVQPGASPERRGGVAELREIAPSTKPKSRKKV